MKFRQALDRGITANHDVDRANQFAGAMPVEQVGKAMVVARHQDRNSGTVVAQSKVILDAIGVGHRAEVLFEA